MEALEKKEESVEIDSRFREEIYSKAVRAGKRTYFFDVKSTRRNEFYLTITESKKKFEPDGNFYFEKHKIFLYKEDFEKFVDGLQEVITFIDQNQVDEYDYENDAEYETANGNQRGNLTISSLEKDYVNIDFEDLSH